MVHARRRISYVIPPPTDPVTPLQLPPHAIPRIGLTGPLFLPSQSATDSYTPKRVAHPRHRLGVVCLALDTATQLVGRSAPEGILYSGGRDGLVMAWDLAIAMRRREWRYGMPRRGEEGRRRGWEVMTGWGDEASDDDDEEGGLDGDLLRRRRKEMEGDVIPFEEQWETDVEAFMPGKPSYFRQCVQTHSDWVNDILLCNYNQTVVSASSDGTIKAWSPHAPAPSDPSLIGSHNDYVRCLTHSRSKNWLVSGSFDRTIKLWDLTRTHTGHSKADPLLTLLPPDAPKSSVYAISADPFGRSIASGSPERVVRLWDPRSGKRTGKLVGHTDNIRAILISEDSRYLLTGSADASVKLWSLASQRCLHTFTHHTDSVWSLSSTHPSLEIFYSGDKSGLVCKIDVEDCADVAEGECIVLCHDASERTAASEGINKIVGMDDNLLWTGSGRSSIKRWRVPPPRAIRAALLPDTLPDHHLTIPTSTPKVPLRTHTETHSPTRPNHDASTHPPSPSLRTSTVPSLHGSPSDPPQHRPGDETTLYGIPFTSLVRLTSPNDPFTPLMPTARGRDPEVATLYSAASVMSVPRTTGRFPLPFNPSAPWSASHTNEHEHDLTNMNMNTGINTARMDFEDRELAAHAQPLCRAPDEVVEGDSGLVRCVVLNDRIHALTVDTAGEVAVWDVVRGVCRGAFARGDVVGARVGSGPTSAWSEGGGEPERSPREALEIVRERIEGEAVVMPWAAADTKTGVLTMHVGEKCFEAEVYADEVGFARDRHFNDESRLNIGKWVLRNLFYGFIREEQRARRKRDNEAAPQRRGSTTALSDISGNSSPRGSSSDVKASAFPSTTASSSSIVICSPKMTPAVALPVSYSTRLSPLMAPMMKLHPIANDAQLPSIPQSSTPGLHNSTGASTPGPRALRVQVSDSAPTGNAPPSAMARDADYFARPPSSSTTATGPVLLPIPDDFSGWAAAGKEQATPVTPGGGLIGRLMHFGKISTKKSGADAGLSSPAPGASVAEPLVVVEEPLSLSINPKQTPLQALLTGSLTPPPATEAPSHPLPPNMPIIISEEASHGWTTIYRGTVSSTSHDLHVLEEAMPMWLLEYLLTNKIPAILVNKISFVLLPWPGKDPDEQLPELLNTTQSKLTASRFLRVRKLVTHVHDKLEKMSNSSAITGSERSSLESPPSPKGSRPRGEDLYEILCGDIILPLDMSLAAVRQYVWRQGAELTMHYRRKLVVTTD